MLPFFVKVNGAIAKRLCTGLQIRLAQFDSGSRLHTNQGLTSDRKSFFVLSVNQVPTRIHKCEWMSGSIHLGSRPLIFCLA
jgi:hypothetical protein